MEKAQRERVKLHHYLMLLVPVIFTATILYVSFVAFTRTSGITGQDTATFPLLRKP